MIRYRKIDGQWVEVNSLKLQEMRERARRNRCELTIDQGERAKIRLAKLRKDCRHDVIDVSQGPSHIVTTCAICGHIL